VDETKSLRLPKSKKIGLSKKVTLEETLSEIPLPPLESGEVKVASEAKPTHISQVVEKLKVFGPQFAKQYREMHPELLKIQELSPSAKAWKVSQILHYPARLFIRMPSSEIKTDTAISLPPLNLPGVLRINSLRLENRPSLPGGYDQKKPPKHRIRRK
jgi:hypothetical protein